VSVPGVTTVESVLDAAGDGAGAVLQHAEQRMLALAAGHGQLLAQYATETISAGGKRLRPLLTCLAAGVPVAPSEALTRAAVAVELVHAATLVHDDVLDAADLRRGRPTVVALRGRLMATAVGDLLLSRAFAELAGGGEPEPVRVLAYAATNVVNGELMQRTDAWRAEVTVDRYLERCRLKTGILFRAAGELGALAGGGEHRADLGLFGERVGVAFQLLDDILDVTGPPARTGKPRGADLLDGTITLPLIEARLRDPALAALDVRTVTDPSSAAEVCDLIAATGALEVVRDRALAVAVEAKSVLSALPAAQRSALELVADSVVERYS
jgi:geranylgeranyl pyrophosphate synthase